MTRDAHEDPARCDDERDETPEDEPPLGEHTQFIAVMAATLAARIAMEQPTWLPGFEQTADELASQRAPAHSIWKQFQRGVSWCRKIVEALGFTNPAEDRLLIVSVLAAQGLAIARSLPGADVPARPASRPRRAARR